MKKITALLLASLMMLAVLCGCAKNDSDGSKESDSSRAETTDKIPEVSDSTSDNSTDEAPDTDVPDETEIRIGTLKGPTGMGMAKLISDSAENAQYKVELYSAPDDITADIISGDLDIAAVPVNLAAVLNKKTNGDVLIGAVNTLGVLYLLENGNTISEISDLKGKTIYATGQGSTPEYILNYILEKNGIDPEKDVTIEYLAEHAELATQLAGNSVSIGMLPEPNVTSVLMQNENVRVALDMTEEWGKVSDTDLVQGCIVVSREFAEKHESLLSKFISDYKASVDFVNNNISEAASLIAEAGIVPKAPIAEKALKRCNIVCVTGEEMKNMVKNMLSVLFEAKPASVGGELPGDDFYYFFK